MKIQLQAEERFKHLNIRLPKLERQTIDGVRYYDIEDNGELIKMVSITSVTSHFIKEIFVKWRKKVGEDEARGGEHPTRWFGPGRSACKQGLGSKHD